jgi:hypothetical protein
LKLTFSNAFNSGSYYHLFKLVEHSPQKYAACGSQNEVELFSQKDNGKSQMLMQPTGIFAQTLTRRASGDLPDALAVASGSNAMPEPRSGSK